MFGYLLLSRGVGSILSTPISTFLSSQRISNPTYAAGSTGFDVGGGRFEKMIIYVGTCFAGAATIAVVGWVVESKKGVSRRS